MARQRGRQPNGRPAIWYDPKDDRWHSQPTVGQKENGKLDRRHVKRKTAGEVAEVVDELLATVRTTGKAPPTKGITVEQWLRHWLENIVKPRRRPKTYEGYRTLIEQHAIPTIGEWRLDGRRKQLEPDHLDALYASMADARRSKTRRALASTTVLKMHRILNIAFAAAVKRGKASRNVCEMVDAPAAKSKKVVSYDIEDAQRLLAAAAEDPMEARWQIGLLLGPRQGEALGIRWSRLKLTAAKPVLLVDKQIQRYTWEHGCTDAAACAAKRCKTKPCGPSWVHGCPDRQLCTSKRQPRHCPARRQVKCKRHQRPCPPPCRPGCRKHAATCPQRVNGGLQEVDVKTEAGERKLPLPPPVVAALERRRQAQMREAQLRGERWDDRGLVFTRPDGRAIDPRQDWAAWKALIARAGVPNNRLHAARHTAATMLAATEKIEVVQELLGHTDIRTARVYVDVAEQAKRDAVTKAAELLLSGNLMHLLQAQSENRPGG